MKTIAAGAGLAVLIFAGAANADQIPTASVCDAASGNVVQNCGFETGDMSNWDPQTFHGSGAGTAAAVATMDQANSGLWSAELSAVGGGTGRTATWEASIDQSVATVVGQSYSIDFYVMSGGAHGSGQFQFDAVDSGSDVVASISFGASNGAFGWKEETFDFTATEGSLKLSFLAAADGSGSDANYFVDDIEVVPQAVPEPASLMLLGSGLLASGAFGSRRRRKTQAPK